MRAFRLFKHNTNNDIEKIFIDQASVERVNPVKLFTHLITRHVSAFTKTNAEKMKELIGCVKYIIWYVQSCA